MIHKNMSIEDIVKKYPETILIFEKYGLGCVGCQAALFENIEQGAEVHGIDVDTLIKDLNNAIPKG
jgi:hybrid cluster-associated redox disulfide protein